MEMQRERNSVGKPGTPFKQAPPNRRRVAPRATGTPYIYNIIYARRVARGARWTVKARQGEENEGRKRTGEGGGDEREVKSTYLGP